MKIAVAGGTGTVGRLVVERVRAAGHEPVVLSRAAGVDLRDRAATDRALVGVDALIDAASVGTTRAATSTEFFHAASGTLLAAARAAGVAHAVLLSIVGIDRNPNGYYAGKVVQEELFERGTVPWTILRATQFHEFAGQVASQARLGPLQLAPRARVQPVAAAEVAARLVALAVSGPQGRAADFAGPREERLERMIRAWVRRDGSRPPVIPVAIPGAQMRGMRAGLNLPAAGATLAGPTFDDWLAAQG
ncbi:SDR family oxidoreductase [Microbacterium oleivorans]|uniref:3-beta hydroxysteroid dehydrogenase n=1 Tax=Microbacterium oleivorans TaxID=273677 RepID=A0A177K8T2_9MICO|nr:NAD(P)H-binding protein [Microbacterium oleivorans]OAH49800.1 3-beta hydroxysteroid dehydrogenase [Microbacterium oleivorans]